MKKMKTMVACLLAGVFFSVSSLTALAAENPEVSTIQDIVSENGYDATVKPLAATTYDIVWGQISKEAEAAELQRKLQKDGFVEMNADGTCAVSITDNNNEQLSVIYVTKAYQNANGDKMLAMFVYDKTAGDLIHTVSNIANVNNEISLYYEGSEYQPPLTRNFNMASFLCGLGSVVACGAFSAMLFAFLPASIAVGASCATAFAYVCSYA